MTKLSISLAAAILSISYAPAASAYSFEPTTSVVVVAFVASPQVAEAEDVCVVSVAPVLAQILALPEHATSGSDGPTRTALACAVDE